MRGFATALMILAASLGPRCLGDRQQWDRGAGSSGMALGCIHSWRILPCHGCTVVNLSSALSTMCWTDTCCWDGMGATRSMMMCTCRDRWGTTGHDRRGCKERSRHLEDGETTEIMTTSPVVGSFPSMYTCKDRAHAKAVLLGSSRLPPHGFGVEINVILRCQHYPNSTFLGPASLP